MKRYKVVFPGRKMGPAWDFNTEILYDYEIQTLPARKFRKLLTAALHGETNTFSRFMRPARLRLCAREWAAIRSEIFRRDDFTCFYCGQRGGRLECDHKIPVSRGGDHSQENLVTACRPCNRRKLAKTAEEFMEMCRG